MYKQQRRLWNFWPWLAGSLALHALLLSCLPGVVTPARSDTIMLVSLASRTDKPHATAPRHDPVAPPETLQKGKPRLSPRRSIPIQPPIERTAQPKVQPAQPAVEAVAPSPIVTSNTEAENATPMPSQPAQMPIADKRTDKAASGALPVPAIGGTSSGSGGQGGVAGVPAPAVAKPSVDVKALIRTYGAGVIARVQGAKYFPDSARDPERSGTTVSVHVKVKVARDGSLLSVSASSEVPELSNAAEDAVRRAAPFGSFPAGVDKSSYNFPFTLQYKLR